MHSPLSSSIGQLPVDRSWFLELNSFARATPWLHAAFRDYAEYGVVLFAAVLVWAWWRSRSSGNLSSEARSCAMVDLPEPGAPVTTTRSGKPGSVIRERD